MVISPTTLGLDIGASQVPPGIGTASTDSLLAITVTVGLPSTPVTYTEKGRFTITNCGCVQATMVGGFQRHRGWTARSLPSATTVTRACPVAGASSQSALQLASSPSAVSPSSTPELLSRTDCTPGSVTVTPVSLT